MLKPVFALAFLAAAALPACPAGAQPAPFPATFREQTIEVDGATIFVRSGGQGPAVVLLHGYTQTGDMWGQLAGELAKTHTVIVPDLRGLGRSSRPDAGYEKATQAKDIRAVVEKLGHDQTAVVGHDIGNMVGYAYAARYPDKTTRLVVMDAPLPGIDPWEAVVRSRALWHFSFGGPDAERLVAGRERIYLDRFWNEFASDPKKIDEGMRSHYAAAYAQPGAMRAGFSHFLAFEQDSRDNKVTQAKKLPMPVLAIGGEKSFGPLMAVNMRNVALDVAEAVVPGSGHWLMEENPTATIGFVRDFLAPTR